MAGDVSSIPWSGRSPGEGNGNPFQYSQLGNPMDRGAWQATVYGVVKELYMTERLNSKKKAELRSHLFLEVSLTDMSRSLSNLSFFIYVQ